MTKKITYEMLVKLGACRDQRDKFKELFPDGVEITIELCAKHAADFEWDWAYEYLLTQPARAECARMWAAARAECARVLATARAEYSRTLSTTARAEYSRTLSTAGAEYSRVFATATAEHSRAQTLAWDECDRALAKAFAVAYLKMESCV